MATSNVTDIGIDLYPRNELEKLMRHMIAVGEVLTIDSTTSLLPHITHHFYFLIDGAIEIWQPPRVLGVLLRPFPIGILELYQPSVLTHLQYKAKTPCKMLVLSKAQWDSVVINAQLHGSVMAVLSYAFHALNEHHRVVTSATHYHVVRELIYLYDKKKFFLIKEKESLLQYILNRTYFSKSHISKILAELKKGNYITLNKGFLITINRTLPMNF